MFLFHNRLVADTGMPTQPLFINFCGTLLVLNEQQLRVILEDYFDDYHRVRPHRSLSHDSPIPRPVESPNRGNIIEMPKVGGLHHEYLRQAA